MATENIIFSYQGAFGPPTFGHYVAMREYAKQILIDYPNSANITMLFMPTALSSSKNHLEPTQGTRIVVLEQFCNLLKLEAEFREQKITFEASNIEYKLCKETKEDGKFNTDTATIRTIMKLKELYPIHILLLGIGFDNMLQLPYWKNIQEYIKHITRIYVVYRKLTFEEESSTRKFNINGAILNFDINIPKWATINIVNKGFFNLDAIVDYAILQSNLNALTLNKKEVYEYFLPLPEIKIIGKIEDATSDTDISIIPATSSSMLRYYICKYIKLKESSTDKKLIDNAYLKLNNLMFGSNLSIEDKDITQSIDKTISDYQIYFANQDNRKICDDDNDKYKANYEAIFGTEPYHSGGKFHKKRKYTYKKKLKSNNIQGYKKSKQNRNITKRNKKRSFTKTSPKAKFYQNFTKG